MAKRARFRTSSAADQAPVFDIRRHHVHPDASVTGERPLTIRTPPVRWAYAVSFLPMWPPSAAAHDGMVLIRLRVLEGEISVICLAADGARVLDEEFCGPTDRDRILALASAPLSACAEVVVRNARTDGQTSVVTIRSVDWQETGASESGDTLRTPESLALEPVPNWSHYYGERGRTAHERLRSARYVMLDHPKRMKWLEGLDINIVPNDELSRVLYLSGTYEPLSLLAMRQLLPEGGVFLDIGANVGLFSMLASRWVGPQGRVFGFEPSAREFGRLHEHITLNNLRNVVAIRKAVAGTRRWLDLRVAQFPHAGHNTTADRFAYDAVAVDRTERVEAITLDEFVADTGLSRLDLVKIDVEGGESAVIDGARRVLETLRPAWIVEISEPALAHRDQSAGDLLARFSAASYRILNRATLADDDHDLGGNVIAVPTERMEWYHLRPRSMPSSHPK